MRFTVVPSTMRSELTEAPVIAMPLTLIVPPALNVTVVPFLTTPPVRMSVDPTAAEMELSATMVIAPP